MDLLNDGSLARCQTVLRVPCQRLMPVTNVVRVASGEPAMISWSGQVTLAADP